MGISAQQHRVCIGLFCSYVRTSKSCFISDSVWSCLLSRQTLGVCIGIFYFYILTFMMFMQVDCAASPHPTSINHFPPIYYSLPNFLTHLNLWFILITFSVIIRGLENMGNVVEDASLLHICRLLFFKAMGRSLRQGNFSGMLLNIALDGLVIFMFILNIFLIIICNPSILNPGPESFSVFFNNVQGFINTRDLSSDSPPLNMTKIHELHGYIYSKKPDVIILNETWLKRCFLDNEIIPDNYKVYRIDRTLKSHPWDPDRPKKFRKHGGGVLIAHRADLNISSVKFTKLKVKAELLSIIMSLPTGRKLCVSTFYRDTVLVL